jgi:hypothetical protein
MYLWIDFILMQSINDYDDSSHLFHILIAVNLYKKINEN